MSGSAFAKNDNLMKTPFKQKHTKHAATMTKAHNQL